MIGGSTRLVALLGQPVAEVALAADAERRLRSARLDWAYLACEVAPEGLAAAVGGLVALGFAGANVTAPHKEAAAELCDEAEGPAVNTLVVRDGRVLGFNTDKAIVAGIEADRVLPDRRRGRGEGAVASAPRRGADVLARWRLAARCLGRRPDRERDARPRRAARRAPSGTDRGRSRLPGRRAPRPPSSRRHVRRAARSSTASRRSSARGCLVRALDGRAGAGGCDAGRSTLRLMLTLTTAGESHGPRSGRDSRRPARRSRPRPRRDRRRPSPSPAGLRPQPPPAAGDRTRSSCSRVCATAGRSGRRLRSSSATAITRTGRGE